MSARGFGRHAGLTSRFRWGASSLLILGLTSGMLAAIAPTAVAQPTPSHITITVNAGVAGASATITTQWSSPVSVSSVGGTIASANLSYSAGSDSGSTTVSGLDAGDTITITESEPGVTFRTWFAYHGALITHVPAAITSMPQMSAFTTDASGTTAPEGFFAGFNNGGSLTSLSAGSFDTSPITTVGDDFFQSFNSEGGRLTSLPAGSFDISGISAAHNGFMLGFNFAGSLTSLPDNSFKTGQITSVGTQFFDDFNSEGGRLTSLPSGSFDISGISAAPDGFMTRFNDSGSLTSLPDNSFKTGRITSVGNEFFSHFNREGRLVSLPVGSFDTSAITTAGDYFFYAFNTGSSRTATAVRSLPEGSFNLSRITTVGSYFLALFNRFGGLTSLPTGSFSPAGVTTAGDEFFYQFNSMGALKSLPAGSFRLDSLVTAGDDLFASFNEGDFNRGEDGRPTAGLISTLPASSFNTARLTKVGSGCFERFNEGGSLGSLPAGSFNTTKITSAGADFFANFNGWFDGKLTGSSKSGVPIYNASKSTVTFQIYSRKAFSSGLNWKEIKVRPGSSFRYYTKTVVPKSLTATPTPRITGTKKVGKTLTAKPGTWKPKKVSLSYRWYRCNAGGTSCAPISKATKSKYKLGRIDRGKTVYVRVTGTKSGYVTVSRSSATTAVVR